MELRSNVRYRPRARRVSGESQYWNPKTKLALTYEHLSDLGV
jgi:hypothetical protein